MTRRLRFGLALMVASLASAQVPRHEFGFTLGQVRQQGRQLSPIPGFAGGALDVGGGTALQANYGLRIVGGKAAAFYIGGHLLASPQRKITGPSDVLTRDFASLYLTPQVTLKLAPGSVVSPWVTFGGGYALYEHSTLTQGGAPNPAGRHSGKGAWVYGGGLDFRLMRFLALRGEVRDFYTGNPTFNLPVRDGRQHNVVLGGGFVLRF
jgi:hypothetical protein